MLSTQVEPGPDFDDPDLCAIYVGALPSRVMSMPFEDVPQLITKLRRSYNEWKKSTEQSDADGVVAAILLQSHVATAPGDFS